MTIRKTTTSDLPALMKIFERARNFMIENGNPTQWKDNYPKQNLIEQDIAQGTSYVVVDDNGKIQGTFMFLSE